MTTFEAIQKIKQMFAEAGELPVASVEEATPSAAPLEAQAEYVLASGAKVVIDKLEIGGKVQLLDEAGNLAPAPMGEHMLADGTKIVLDEAGMIVEIESPKADVVEEVIPEEASPVATPSIEEELKKKMEEMAAEIAELKKQYKEKMAAQEQRFSKGISDLSDVVIELINTSSAKPTEQPKDKFNVHVESKDSKLQRFLEFAKSIK